MIGDVLRTEDRSSETPTPARFPSVIPGPLGTVEWTRRPILRRPISVRVTGWPVAASPWRRLPYMQTNAASIHTDAATSDDDGVRFHAVEGRRYDQPMLQSRTALAMINGHRLTGDVRYLERAKANAHRILECATQRRGALYLPYRYIHHLKTATMTPAWYSAMAQGLALSMTSRLAALESDPRWRTAADLLFASFLQPRRRRRPWTVHADECAHLWLEEYPDPSCGAPMRVLNGHLFATIGVYDYLWLTGSEQAAVVFDAAATTIADHGHDFRVPGECSWYSLTTPAQKPAYHATHVWQIERLGSWTGDDTFTRLSRAMADDFSIADQAPSVDDRSSST